MINKLDFGKPHINIASPESRDLIATAIYNGYVTETGGYSVREGLREKYVLNTGNGSIDGIITTNRDDGLEHHTYAMHNQILYKTTDNLVGYTVEALSGINSAGRTAYFDQSVSKIFLADGGRINIIDKETNEVVVLSGEGHPDNVTHLCFAEGYLIANGNITEGVPGDVYYSDDIENDYDAWEFFNAEQRHDKCIGLHYASWGELYVFGTNSLEASYNDGETPWAVVESSYSSVGLVAPDSIVEIADSVYFYGSKDGVQHLYAIDRNSRTPRIVTTDFDLWDGLELNFSNARGFSLKIGGKPGYAFVNMNGSESFVYDITNQCTTTLTSRGGYPYLGCCSYDARESYDSIHVNTQLVGDASTGIIYTPTMATQMDGNDDALGIEFILIGPQVSWGTYQRKRSKNIIYKAMLEGIIGS